MLLETILLTTFHAVDARTCEQLRANPHRSVRQIFMGENGSPHPPTLRVTSVYPGHALIPRTPCRTPAGNGFVLHGPRGACSRGWRPSRAGPFSHGQLLRSRRVSEGKTWTWNDPSKQSPPWVHPQAKAPVPLTLKFSCSSLFLDLFFQLDQYIFQRGITPPPSSPASILTCSHTISTAPSTLLQTLTFFTPLALQKRKSLLCLQPSICFLFFAHTC